VLGCWGEGEMGRWGDGEMGSNVETRHGASGSVGSGGRQGGQGRNYLFPVPY
jgi:hypothetical protein